MQTLNSFLLQVIVHDREPRQWACDYLNERAPCQRYFKWWDGALHLPVPSNSTKFGIYYSDYGPEVPEIATGIQVSKHSISLVEHTKHMSKSWTCFAMAFYVLSNSSFS